MGRRDYKPKPKPPRSKPSSELKLELGTGPKPVPSPGPKQQHSAQTAPFRDFFRAHIGAIRLGEFGLSATCIMGVLFSGGDMLLASIGLFFAWIFAFAGIMA